MEYSYVNTNWNLPITPSFLWYGPQCLGFTDTLFAVLQVIYTSLLRRVLVWSVFFFPMSVQHTKSFLTNHLSSGYLKFIDCSISIQSLFFSIIILAQINFNNKLKDWYLSSLHLVSVSNPLLSNA